MHMPLTKRRPSQAATQLRRPMAIMVADSSEASAV